MGTDWRAIAIELGDRMRYNDSCDTHPVTHPDKDCPFCADRAVYLRYKAAADAEGISTRTHLDALTEGTQGVDVLQLVRESRETDSLATPGLPKVRRGLSPVQQEVLVHTHDHTLGGAAIIVGKQVTVRSLIHKGLAEHHHSYGGHTPGYISAKRTPAGDEVRQALLDVGAVDPGPQY